ncbi:MAG TPA: peptide-binding protein [Planctomycetaceae bacterium]|nr:peptide-binding protein [Planctomycetaceae bacterium]
MTGVTIKILHGADRGKVFHNIEPPVTIGREEGNSIQLNDERVSRCHFKIQRDNDRLVLTDLDSTNGTKVNGDECQLKILRHGDLISVGRSLMLVGTEEQIAARIAAMGTHGPTIAHDSSGGENSLLFDLDDEQASPRPNLSFLAGCEPPSIPDRLSPGQAAQMCEILEFVQSRLHRLIEVAKVDDASGCVTMGLANWQQLLEVQSRLATMIRKVADPGG